MKQTVCLLSKTELNKLQPFFKCFLPLLISLTFSEYRHRIAFVLPLFPPINQAVHSLWLCLAKQLSWGTDQQISSKKSSALWNDFISNCFYWLGSSKLVAALFGLLSKSIRHKSEEGRKNWSVCVISTLASWTVLLEAFRFLYIFKCWLTV